MERAGRLSNPRSDLNQAVDQLLEGMEVIVARQQGRTTSRRGVLKQLSPRDVDALVRSYQAGASVRQLVEEFEIHRTTVLTHLEKRGIPRRANTRKLTDEQAMEARAMRDTGVPYAEIARKYRVHPKTVKREVDSAY